MAEMGSEAIRLEFTLGMWIFFFYHAVSLHTTGDADFERGDKASPFGSVSLLVFYYLERRAFERTFYKLKVYF